MGKFFFQTVATRESVKNILCQVNTLNLKFKRLISFNETYLIKQCYHDTSQVTEELVDTILKPGLQPGAADVFLEFICYSDGPLPEELLPQVKVD